MVFFGPLLVNRCFQYCSIVVIREVNDEFEVTEELASLNNLCGTITGENFTRKLTLNQYKQTWNLLGCVTTDDGKNICEAEKC